MVDPLDAPLLPDAKDTGTFFEVLKDVKMDLPDKPSPVRDNAMATIDLQPDAAAEIFKLAKRTGEHPAYVAENLDAVKRGVSIPPEPSLQQMKTMFPVTHKHLSTASQYVTAKDDIENLTGTEQIVKDHGFWGSLWDGAAWATRAVGTGVLKTAASATQIPRGVAGAALLPYNLTLKAEGQKRFEWSGPKWLQFEDSARWWEEKAAAIQVPEANESFWQTLKQGKIADAGTVLAAQVLEGSPQLAALIVGSYLGAEVPALVGMGALTAGEAERRASKAGLEPAVASMNAVSQAAIQTVTMKLATLGPLKKYSNAIANTYGKDTAAKVMKSFGQAMVGTYAGGALQGGAMTVGGTMVDALSGLPTPTAGELLLRTADSMMLMGVQNMTMVGPSAILQGVYRATALQKANEAKKVYLAMGDSAEASKLRARLPEQHKQFIQEVTKGTPTESVLVPASAFETYFQSKNIPPEQMAANLGVSDQLQALKGTEENLRIPMHEWTDKIVGTEHWKGMADDVKFNPESLTVNQTKARVTAEEKAVVDEANAIAKANPVVKDGMDFIYADMVEKQSKSGAYNKFEDAQKIIDANAKFFAATVATEAATKGVDPKVYYSEMMKPVEITTAKPGTQEATLQSAKDIQAHEDWQYWQPERTSAGAIKGAPDNITARKLPGLRAKLRQLVQEGVPGRHWFRDVATEAMRITGGDIAEADKFLQLLAIYSPHQQVPQNTQNAINVYTQWKNGAPREQIHAATGVQDENARKFLFDGKEWVGRKTNSFYKNMLHELIAKASPEDIQRLGIDTAFLNDVRKPVTVDLWILRAFGYMNAAAADDVGTGKYSFAENEIRRITSELNSRLAPGEEPWEPHQTQAAMWTAIKARHEVPSVKEAAKAKSVKLGLSTIEAGKFKAPTSAETKRKHATLWRDLALGAKPEEVGPSVQKAKTSFGDIMRQSTINVTWEAVPSPSLKLEITTAPPEVRAAFTKEVADIIVDPATGKDLLADKLGLKLGRTSPGHGGYEGAINENVIAGLVPTKKGSLRDVESVKAYARAIQYITRQNAVPYFRADASAKFEGDFKVIKGERTVRAFDTQAEAEAFAKTQEDATIKGGPFARGVLFRFRSPLSIESETAFFDQLRKSLGKDAGYTRLNEREIAVINFRDDATGLPFADDVGFLDALDRMGAEHGKRLGIEAGEKLGSQGEYGPVHDWQADAEGQALLSDRHLQGSPDLQGWIRGRRALFDEIVQRYSGQDLQQRQAELGTVQKLQPAEVAFQSDIVNPDDARAYIAFLPEKTIVGLPNADPSSFIHENMHGWVQRLEAWVAAGKGTPQDQATLDFLRKFTGTPEGEPVRKSEKLAKAAERYAAEGIAPSEYLKEPFARYSRWISKVYRSLDELGAETSPEMRAFFDRMLASEDEIAFARQQQGLDIIADPQNLDPAVKAKLTKLRQEAHDEAVRELTVKQMKELTQERKDFLAAEEVKARKAATEEVSKQQEYVASESLKRSMKQEAKTLAVKFLDGKFDEEQTLSFRMLAQVNGYSSAEEMAQKLLSAPTLKDAIEANVRDKMAQHDALKNTDEIKLEAMKAVHNSKAVELLAAEQGLFQSLVDEAQGRAEQAKMRRQEARIAAAETKRAAAQIIANSTLRDASSFMRYFTAERQAALEAQQAAADGQFQKAADAKARQMRNHALAMEAFHARGFIDKWQDYLHGVTLKEKRLFKREEHFNQVAALLSRFAEGRRDFDPSTRTETLAQYADRMFQNDEAVAIPQWLMDETVSKKFSDLTVSEANDLVDTVKNIQHIANVQNEFLALEKGAVVSERIAQLGKVAAENNKARPPEQIIPKRGRWESAKDWAKKYSSFLRQTENIALKMDGWKEGGLWYKTLFAPVERAGDAESVMLAKTNKALDELLKSHYDDRTRASLTDENKTIYVPELGQSVRKIDLIMMAMNTGNESNRDRLFTSRLVGVDPSMAWGEDVVMGMLQRHLTATDWKFVQGTWNLINSLWPDMVDLHKRLTGFSPKKIDATPFDVHTADGQLVSMDGGYFPLKSDTRQNIRQQMIETMDNPLYKEKFAPWFAATKTGHLKNRVEGAEYPVRLDSSIISGHLQDAIHDLAFRETIIDLRRLVNNQQFADTVRTYGGPEFYQSLRDWVGSAASGNAREKAGLDFAEQTTRSLRRNYVAAVLTFNAKIVTQNLANIFLYGRAVPDFSHIDAWTGFVRHGLTDFLPASLLRLGRADAVRNEVFSKSAWMRDKHTNPEYSLASTMDAAFGKKHPISDFFWGFFAATDELTSIPVWKTAYEKALATKSEPEAIAYADSVIRRSLGAARKFETAPVFRSGEMARSLAMFQSFMNAQLNRFERERGILSKDYIKNAPAFLGYVGAHFGLFAATSSLFSGIWPSFSDPEKNKKFVRSIALYPTQIYAGFNGIAQIVADQAFGLQSYGYRPMPSIEVINKGLDAVKAGVALARGERETTSAVEAVTHGVAFATGQPDQFVNMFWNAYDIAVEGMDPRVEDLLRRRPRAER